MINPDNRQRSQLLDEVERQVGYVGYAEFWLQIPAPDRAGNQQLERWRALPTGEKLRVADQYDARYSAAERRVFSRWTYQQRVKNSIRVASVVMTVLVMFLLCVAVHDMLPSAATHSAVFLPIWWFTSLVTVAGLYSLICHLAERWFELDNPGARLLG